MGDGEGRTVGTINRSQVVENIARNVSVWRGIVVVRHAEEYIARGASELEGSKKKVQAVTRRRGYDVLPVRASARLSARARAG